jgi:hypothetical protein
MTPKQVDTTFRKLTGQEVAITPHLFSVIQQGNPNEWESLFASLRLALQSRLAGAQSVNDLLKLQGKVEYIDELEAFFTRILSPKG